MDKRRRHRCEEACITCKRRKEKCDGNKPCARCIQRGVETGCIFRARTSRRNSRHDSGHESSGHIASDVANQQRIPQDHNVPGDGGLLTVINSNASTTSVPDTSRLIMDTKGKYMFIGDSANLSLLQHIRNLVQVSIGSCQFVEDPLRYQMVEAAPTGSASWLHATEQQSPTKPSLQEATYLIRWYSFATNCVLDLFDEKDLLSSLSSWLEASSDGTHVLSAIYYLVFALGAQTCPDDKDAVASLYFDYGRYLTASYLTEDPSISTVQAYAMITMYMLCASRRNAAFMYLGTAVRAAYALGLHRSDISGLFAPAEHQIRERLWKVMRILDLFMSASLGRPPSTAETRNTELKDNYSASNDLCAIFEKILSDMYAKRMVSTEVLEHISRHHRRWTVRFREGLDTDRIEGNDFVDGQRPNIGLLHVKEAYYWTIILLARPFFMESISNHIAIKSLIQGDGHRTPDLSQSSHQILVHACIDSAISTGDLLRILLTAEDLPKRLPFIVNSLFVSGLVLGLSYFGDWYKTYPLDESLGTVLRLLALFPNDAIAKRNLTILELLFDACKVYVKQQARRNEKRQKNLVGVMFGRMDVTNVLERPAGGASAPSHDQSQKLDDRYPEQSLPTYDETRRPRSQHAGAVPRDARLDFDTDSRPDRSPDSFQLLHPDFPTTSDYLTAPVMSPRTLWFDSYENNMPLFSTIDAREFVD